jgi:hypothetical protein
MAKPCAAGLLGVLIFLAPPALAARLELASDADLETRYACGGGGTYAPETGIRWYREWDGCYVKYPARVGMPHKIWTVGKMDYRPTSIRGGPSNTVLSLPYPGTYTPDAALIANILAGEGPFIRQTIEYSPAHRGNIWTIANEPNWAPKFTPADYAREFHDYAAFIRSVDPDARIATGGILVSNGYVGPGYSGTPWYQWLDAFRAAHVELYGTPPAVDVWDIHPYDLGDNSGGTTPARKAINNIIAMRQYLDAAGLGDAPIQISEIALLGVSDNAAQVAFINELFTWLNTNAAGFKVDRWFWWGSTTVAFGPTGLFDGAYNRANINVKGDAYMRQMGRVFVDPAFTPDTTRGYGSMRNPYPSLNAVLEAYHAGAGDLRIGTVVYDFSTARNYVIRATSPADVDRDGDVDQEDFGRFQTCLTPLGSTIEATCQPLDFNRDSAIDGADLARFAGCLTGPNQVADPSCPGG